MSINDIIKLINKREVYFMAEAKSYHEQIQIDQTLRLREVLKTLPPFAKDYFRAMILKYFRQSLKMPPKPHRWFQNPC